MHGTGRKSGMAFCLSGLLLMAGSASAQTTAPLAALEVALPQLQPPDLSVMTYNVKGLPWPIARGRPQALTTIAERLADMREGGVQPAVVVLQEAFVSRAKRIGDEAGYRYKATGAGIPGASRPSSRRFPLRRLNREPQLDSGLLVLSDYPIVDVRSAAFPSNACAGLDCFAAKGVVLVTVEIPGKGKVQVATTHLNSRGASMAPSKETVRAYREQVAFLCEFLGKERDSSIPLVLAGDFNLGNTAERLEILPPALEDLNGGAAPDEPFRNFVQATDLEISRSDDARWVVERARDMQYVLPGGGRTLSALSARIPFGSKTPGGPLSDHFGYTIEYRLTEAGSQFAPRHAQRPVLAERSGGTGADVRLPGSGEAVSAQ